MKRMLIGALIALNSIGPAYAGTLSATDREAALAALDDEYHALATYEAVIAKFGAVRPFVNIRKAEAQHAGAVIGYLQAQGEAVPENPYLTGAKPAPEVPATLTAACDLGVQAEIANKDLYDVKLLPMVADNAELTRILTALRDASQNNHLPAFQRCAS